MVTCACLACQLDLAVACVETEQRIRASQRAFDLQEVQATVRDLGWLLDRIAGEGATDEHLGSFRAHVRRLTVQPPLEPPGEPSADSEGPQTGLPGWARRRMEQDEARIEALQAEVRRLRAARSAA